MIIRRGDKKGGEGVMEIRGKGGSDVRTGGGGG